MTVTLDSKRRLTVPTALMPTTAGDVFEAHYDEQEDEIVLRRVRRHQQSWVAAMKACPVAMDDLPPRSRELPKNIKL